MSKARRNIMILAAVGSCVLIDQLTKVIAKEHLLGAGVYSFVNDIFRLVYTENAGAFLGLGNSLPEWVRFWVFTVGVGVILLAIGVHVLVREHGDSLVHSAIVLVLAGGVGNLIDRVFNDGHVVDFMNLGIGGLRTGVFNVADMCITAGVVGLLLVEIRAVKQRQTQSPSNSSLANGSD